MKVGIGIAKLTTFASLIVLHVASSRTARERENHILTTFSNRWNNGFELRQARDVRLMAVEACTLDGIVHIFRDEFDVLGVGSAKKLDNNSAFSVLVEVLLLTPGIDV